MPTAAVDQKALVRSLRNYLAGQVVGLSRDETLLDELLKCAFCYRHAGLAHFDNCVKERSFSG